MADAVAAVGGNLLCGWLHSPKVTGTLLIRSDRLIVGVVAVDVQFVQGIPCRRHYHLTSRLFAG